MPRPGRVDQGAGRRARDEDPRQVEQQRRVLVAARIQPGQRHQQFAAAQVGIADQVEGGIGRDEAVFVERRATDARRRCGSPARSRRDRARGRGAGRGLRPWDGSRSMVSSSSATGAPIAAQSGDASSRARISASRSACSRGCVAQFGQPGPAQQRPQRRIAERGLVEFRRDAGRRRRISAAGDRRRRTATGRPCRAVSAR